MVQSLILQSHVKHRVSASMYPQHYRWRRNTAEDIAESEGHKAALHRQLGIMKHLFTMLLCKFGSIF